MSTPEIHAGPVTVHVVRELAHDDHASFIDWVTRGERLIRGLPGFLGVGWLRDDDASRTWHVLFRFATAADLDRWDDSPQRAAWFDEYRDQLRAETRDVTGIEGWFDTRAQHETVQLAEAAPPRWKQAVVILIGFLPLNIAMNFTLGAWLAALGVPTLARLTLLVLLMTPVMTYWVLPFVTRRLAGWLRPRPAE